MQCEFKIVLTFRWRIWECGKENKTCSIQGRGKISHVCNVGHEGQYWICGEYGEPFDVEGRFTALDGHKTCHEVFESHNGSPKRDKNYPILFVWTNGKIIIIKGKARRAWDHLTPSIVHMPLCMYICLYNFISSPIEIQQVIGRGIDTFSIIHGNSSTMPIPMPWHCIHFSNLPIRCLIVVIILNLQPLSH